MVPRSDTPNLAFASAFAAAFSRPTPARGSSVFAVFLLCFLLSGTTAFAQGFGYTHATPEQGVATMSVQGFLYGYPSNPNVGFDASSSRDSAGVAAGSTILFNFNEAHSRYNNYFTYSHVTGICSDYNAASSSCQNGWQNVAASAASKVASFPTLPSGSDVSERFMGVRIKADKYNTLGQFVGSTTGVVTTSYFLVPPADLFFRNDSGDEVAVWRQRTYSTGGDLYRPLVIAEGIDIGDAAEPDEYFGQLGPLANVLRDGGFDVAVVSFGQPLLSVRVHEVGFRNSVRLVHQMKDDPSRPSVVMGISRGGVVARYALARMEELGLDHHTSVFISYDSPQRGANINADLQELVFDRLEGDPEGDILIDQLKSDAVMELLQDHVDNRGAGPDLHEEFYLELESLNGGAGYPSDLRTVAWSNGTWAPPQFSGNLFLEVDAQASGQDIEITLSTLDRRPGSFLPASFRNLVDGRDGNADLPILKDVGAFALAWLFSPFTAFTQNFGTFYRIEVHNDPTFIPTESALDRDGPSATTPFDRAERSTRRRSHAAVPDEAVTVILEELGLLAPPPPLTVSISGPSSMEVGETGTWVANVQNGTGPISYTWHWQRTCLEVLNPSQEGEESDPETFGGGNDPEPDDVPVCEWYANLPNSQQSYSMSRPQAGPIKIRVVVSRGSETVTRYKTVSVTWGNNMQAESDSSEASLMASLGSGLPDEYTLYGMVPNPASGVAAIRYDLPESSQVSLVVYDLMGREVARLENGTREAGYHDIPFETSALPAGVYLVNMRAGEFHATERMTIVK